MIRRLLLVACATLVLVACDSKPGSSDPGAAFHSVDITGAGYAQGFALTDTSGKRRTLADFAGKVTVVFFGYTQCPDVCPTTMAELAEVKRALGPDGERVQGVFITVDPQRDTPEALKAYMEGFDPSFVALTGTPEEVKAAAKDFKVFYAKSEGKGGGAYTMDHTAGSYVFDANGKPRLFVRYGMGAQALAEDIRKLLATG
jgi:protein SCO1/2